MLLTVDGLLEDSAEMAGSMDETEDRRRKHCIIPADGIIAAARQHDRGSSGQRRQQQHDNTIVVACLC